MLLQVFEKAGKSIVDAERNRRTLEKPASHFRWFDGGASSKPTKQVPNTASNGTKKVPKWVPKSMQNRAGVAEAFRERSVPPLKVLRGHFGTHFGTSFA